MPVKKTYQFSFEEYTSVNQLEKAERNLVDNAVKAAEDAYTPYSKFNVGAAVLLENGIIITGSNQENAAYPSGLCAERVALFYASSQYPQTPVRAIAIVAQKNGTLIDIPVPPCGSCRQVFTEWEKRFNQSFVVIMAGNRKVIRLEKADYLLPFSFQKEFL